MIIEQERPFVSVFSKNSDGLLLFADYNFENPTILLQNMDIALALDDIYEDIVFGKEASALKSPPDCTAIPRRFFCFLFQKKAYLCHIIRHWSLGIRDWFARINKRGIKKPQKTTIPPSTNH
jgi:hypothetical protein